MIDRQTVYYYSGDNTVNYGTSQDRLYELYNIRLLAGSSIASVRPSLAKVDIQPRTIVPSVH